MLAMFVNDNAIILTHRGGLGFFAGKPAPTGIVSRLPFVGAGLLAMVVNDDASILMPRDALGFFAGKPAPTNQPGQRAMIAAKLDVVRLSVINPVEAPSRGSELVARTCRRHR